MSARFVWTPFLVYLKAFPAVAMARP